MQTIDILTDPETEKRIFALLEERELLWERSPWGGIFVKHQDEKIIDGVTFWLDENDVYWEYQ
ncbi:hypothetical protein ACXWTF_13030 [Thiomicrolovo sp. ZZH C-3]